MYNPQGSKIEGIAHVITVESELNLDRYEGYLKQHYGKRILSVTSESGEVECLMCVANSEMMAKEPKPEKTHLCRLLQGKKFRSDGQLALGILNRLQRKKCVK